jgi:hypothetical protein
MLAFVFQAGVGWILERSQQVAVAERLRKREPSQLAPGVAFFHGAAYVLLTFY